MQKNFLKNRGFTLIELMATLSIFVILTLIASNFIIKGMQLKRNSSARISATEEAHKTIKNITKEIRNSTQSDRGEYNLSKTEAFEFSFYTFVSSGNQVEKIRYFLDGKDLVKGAIAPSGEHFEYLEENETLIVAARYINNAEEPIFTYFDGNNNLMENPAENISAVRMVGIFLKINPSFREKDKDFILNTSVQIRNLKDNL